MKSNVNKRAFLALGLLILLICGIIIGMDLLTDREAMPVDTNLAQVPVEPTAEHDVPAADSAPAESTAAEEAALPEAAPLKEAHAPVTAEAQVSVHPEQAIGPVYKELFGIHAPAWNETVYLNGNIHPALLRNAKQAGIQFLVYPGGNYGYDFIWNDMKLNAEMDTDEFLKLASELDATMKISLNPEQPPELAVDWLNYLNKEKKAGVRYWEVADEPYLLMKADRFIEKMKLFVPKLKAADPTVKIIANVSAANPKYTKAVIKEAGDLIDIYSIHYFPLAPSRSVSDSSPYSEDDKSAFFKDLLASSEQFRSQLNAVKGMVEEQWPDRTVDYHVGSYGTVWWGPEDWTVNSLPAGLWVADMLGVFAEEQVTAAAYWALMNPYPPEDGDFGMFSPEMKPYVSAYAFELFSKYFGDTMVESESSAPSLSVYSSTGNDGKDLYVMLINKSADEEMRTKLELGGFQPRGDAAAVLLGGPVIPEHVYDYGLSKQWMDIEAGELEHTIPPYTAAVIHIPGADSASSLEDSPNLALHKRADASSSAMMNAKYYSVNDYAPHYAFDGDYSTRWASKIFQDEDEWLSVNLGQVRTFNEIQLYWEYAATKYAVEISVDGESWTEAATYKDAEKLKRGAQPIEKLLLKDPMEAQFVRIIMENRPRESGAKAGSSQWTPQAYSLWEMEVSYVK